MNIFNKFGIYKKNVYKYICILRKYLKMMIYFFSLAFKN